MKIQMSEVGGQMSEKTQRSLIKNEAGLLSIDPNIAKLFCKRSQIAFMPYGVVLKDER